MVVGTPPAEVAITPDLVRALLEEQRSDLAGLPLEILGEGWDNVTFTLGASLVARLPRRSLSAKLVENEAIWLPTLASGLPIPVPAPVFLGRPGMGYPWHWALAPRMEGEPPGADTSFDEPTVATRIGAFLSALHIPAPPEAPVNEYRGIPLSDRDQTTRERLSTLGDLVDGSRLLDVWETGCQAPLYEGPPVWLHGDLHPRNLLLSDGEVSAVIDFGDITSGDPATDLAVAWMLFDAAGRDRLRQGYGRADDPTWARAGAWAVSLASSYLAHSADDPVLGAIGERTLRRLCE